VLESGGVFPPVILFFDGGENVFIGDGWQRVFAHKIIGRDEIEATMRAGGLRDAILFAAGANADHGLRRSDADKRSAVQILLNDPEWGKWSQRKIASHCNVSGWLVGEMQKEQKEPEKKKGEDGVENEELGEEDEELGEEDEESEENDQGEEADSNEDEPDKVSEWGKPIKSWVLNLSRLKREAVDLAKDPIKGVYLRDKVTRIGRMFDELRTVLRGVETTAECEACSGKGCADCLDTGLITRHMFESRRKKE